ncbi:LuxR C-terminal-related transcriptional regulator [Streptomyces pyxinae]|uniref:LuxR C-terminal-related transcriptional regulator n=1 Tax=Streptomyces pyxinae TaxID=2970734 RepID=UPI002867E2E0|nr:LuxR C-terminal-related transcriptional regulator [Streptomyces sp. LP05-1]
MLSTLAPPRDTPLRGRRCELDRLGAVLDATRRGGTALIVVEAPPGYGKTQLLRAAMELAERLGYAVAGPAGARPVSRAAAGLRGAGASGRRGPTGAAHRVPGEPVLVVLDEFQHLDPGAGAVGGPFARYGVHRDRVVWLAARRTDTGQDRRGALLSDPRRRYERLVLGPLGPVAALQLAADVLGVPPGPAVARLVERAGGHPRMLTELLIGMREEGTIRTDGAEAELTGARLPDRVRARVRATLGQYSRECRQFLSVAAVLGAEVEYTELSAMLGRPLSALLPVMEEACATGVVRHSADRLVFHSALMRHAVQEVVPDALKRVLHQEVALLRAPGAARPGPHAPADLREPGGEGAPWAVAAPAYGPGAVPGYGPGAADGYGPGPWDAQRFGGARPVTEPSSAGRPGPADAVGAGVEPVPRDPVRQGNGERPGDGGAAAAEAYPGVVPAESAAPPRGPRLSGQQRELVLLVSEGLTNRQMATRLGLSPHTVNYHLRRLFKGYGVNSRIDLLRAVAEHHRPPAGAPAVPGAGPGSRPGAPLAPALLAPLASPPAPTAAAPAPAAPAPRAPAGPATPAAPLPPSATGRRPVPRGRRRRP